MVEPVVASIVAYAWLGETLSRYPDWVREAIAACATARKVAAVAAPAPLLATARCAVALGVAVVGPGKAALVADTGLALVVVVKIIVTALLLGGKHGTRAEAKPAEPVAAAVAAPAPPAAGHRPATRSSTAARASDPLL